jgi:dGTPase
VTQVITPFSEFPLLHNRLTHSEKVAQVARAIAETLISNPDNWPVMQRLGGFDVDACEAAGLAHDLGHPPFGHIGESVLDKSSRNVLGLAEGFEGNAQSLRILAIGKSRSTKYEGLDLTRATLAAVAKYPWVRMKREERDDDHAEKLSADGEYRRHWRKFNAYASQSSLLTDCRSFLPDGFGDQMQTLEASVMDAADDITYAVHDLEDFYLADVLDSATIMADIESFLNPNDSTITPFTELAARLQVDYETWFDSSMLKEAAKFVEQTLRYGFLRDRRNFTQREATAREKCSDLIGEFIGGIELSETPLWDGGPRVGLGKERWHQIQVLKEITKSYVVQRADIALLQRGQEAALERFVAMLHDWSLNDVKRLPSRLRAEIEIAKGLESGEIEEGYVAEQSAPRGKANRAIVDYICSLTDMECLQIYYNLSGIQIYKPGIPTY